MKVNGEVINLLKEQTLQDFLVERQLDGKNIAVEYNGVLVRQAEYQNLVLAATDNLEIVSFVGGG